MAAAVAVVLAVAGCSSQEPVTSATAVAPPPATSVVIPTDTATPTDTALPTDTADSPPAQPATSVAVAPTPRPGSQEVRVDEAAFHSNGGGGYGFYFRSPSGNVSCGLYPQPTSVGYLGCQAVESVAPVGGEVCTNAPDNKYAVRDDGAGAIHYCTNQGYFTGDENIRTLQYGELIQAGPAFCVSREDGVACGLVGSSGFFLSRDENLTLR